MIRRTLTPRPDRHARARSMGFSYAEIGGEPYWDETAAYEFTSSEIDELEAATTEIQRICLKACAQAVADRRHVLLGIPETVWPLVTQSWEIGEPSLYGRLDLRWDGTGPPKLLEYNADTPTALYEASVVQWEWLTSLRPEADQFNSLHEALVKAWRSMRLPSSVYFTSMRRSVEDKVTVDYLRDTATQAGLGATYIALEDIGWNGRTFTDRNENHIETIFKLYPWEWMLRDEFGPHLPLAMTRWIEPAWRLLLSSKGLLALLWEMFPNHPNLLPAYRRPGLTRGPEIQKPLFGREGANILAPHYQTTGPYGNGGFVHQRYDELPCFDRQYPVIGSWIVAGSSVGIGIREDGTPITQNTSRFVPHYFDL